MRARHRIESFLGDIKVRAIVARELRGSLAACEKHLDPETAGKVRAAFIEACPYIEAPLIAAMIERAEAGEKDWP